MVSLYLNSRQRPTSYRTYGKKPQPFKPSKEETELSGYETAKELTPDYVYVVGESTLETLPGTITPPSAIYSPKEKLVDSCISITSTPTKSTCSNNNEETAMNQLNQYLSIKTRKTKKEKPTKRVYFVLSDGANVDGRGNPITNSLTKEEIEKRRRIHRKILRKRKKMWKNYQKVKMKHHCTTKLALVIRGIKIKIKKNDGDLI